MVDGGKVDRHLAKQVIFGTSPSSVIISESDLLGNRSQHAPNDSKAPAFGESFVNISRLAEAQLEIGALLFDLNPMKEVSQNNDRKRNSDRPKHYTPHISLLIWRVPYKTRPIQ